MTKLIKKLLLQVQLVLLAFHYQKLLQRGDYVIGVDNHNNYYDPEIKDARLQNLEKYPNYKHYRIDLSDKESLEKVFKQNNPYKVVNLAAQAGVRYSIEKPLAYINSNILGFAHILENCRHYKIKHLVYASTSSVYGANTKCLFQSMIVLTILFLSMQHLKNLMN